MAIAIELGTVTTLQCAWTGNSHNVMHAYISHIYRAYVQQIRKFVVITKLTLAEKSE